jgi:ApbE superfamily uncharacterized protein (UPF0280 family)
MEAPQAHMLPDGKRLHLNHGPIDLIIEAFGDAEEVLAAYSQAVTRFQTILTELVAELRELRRPGTLSTPRCFHGSTARRMEAAIVRFAADFITPMAAVAGSVADEIMDAMLRDRRIEKAYVNNGGDVALYLRRDAGMREGSTHAAPPKPELTIAIAGTGNGFADRLTIRSSDPVRGIATSGWRGRSFSLGIADAVTVLAQTAADADAAATIIANNVDLPGHFAISRRPANELAPDSDLGGMLITVGVGSLTRDEIATALDHGLAIAQDLKQRGLIQSAALFLAGDSRVCGELSLQDRAEDIPSIPLDLFPRQLAKPRTYLPARPLQLSKEHPHA